jgi:hypothetical protein
MLKSSKEYYSAANPKSCTYGNLDSYIVGKPYRPIVAPVPVLTVPTTPNNYMKQ